MNKRKLFGGLIIPLFFMLLLSGCSEESATVDSDEIIVKSLNKRFTQQKLDNFWGCNLYILIDRETDIQYFKSSCSDSGGNITPVLNTDGTPFIGKSVDKKRFTIKSLKGMDLIIDNETQINYFFFSEDIIPLLNPDGTIYTSKIKVDKKVKQENAEIEELKEKIKVLEEKLQTQGS